MAEPLKNKYGPEVPRRIAGMIARVHPAFEADAFLADALDGYDALELMPRGRRIAAAMRAHLPQDFVEAVAVLLRSLGPKLDSFESFGLGPFLYLPHTMFVGEYGLDHFEASMEAQHELTQRFTAEFSIRGFLERHRERTLERLREWTRDPSPHVRRLVSEGTRPRLPWAPRLRDFQRDPAPVLELLELLKDDPELYVRRSVANNLNDIGKDHPGILSDVVRRWSIGASAERAWVIRHALRSAIKRGDPAALDAVGAGKPPQVRAVCFLAAPEEPRIGGSVELRFSLESTARAEQRLLVDLGVCFVKADGRASAKVFKLAETALAPGARAEFRKRISLAQMTTRTHYPGQHQVFAQVNGRIFELGAFHLAAAPLE